MLDFTEENWAFPVQLDDVFDNDGNKIPGYVRVVDERSNRSLAIHSDSYRLVTHEDVASSIIDAARASAVSGDFTVNVTATDDGRKMRGEILFNDATIEPDVGDYVAFRTSFFNSYDASWSVGMQGEGLRLWCKNGCTTPDRAASFRAKHTVNFDIEAMAAKIQTAFELFKESPALYRLWMSTPCDMEQFEILCKQTVCKVSQNRTAEDGDRTVNAKQLERLLVGFKSERAWLGPNKWAAYNALTAWASHPDTSNPLVTTRIRETMLARALASESWASIS